MTSLFGALNPNWKGGPVSKLCSVCFTEFSVKPVHSNARHCSLKCVGISQRGLSKRPSTKLTKSCEVCTAEYQVFPAHAHRHHCCSKSCSFVRRKSIAAGENNANWNGGVSRLPYPFNFRDISKSIIERDGGTCRNPDCSGSDLRMTTHHINYDKQDCRGSNLIALCSSCNSKANFGRQQWQQFYEGLMAARGF